MRSLRRLEFLVVALSLIATPWTSRLARAQAEQRNRTPIVPGMGDPKSVNETPFGNASEQLTLELPPARRDFKPRIVLSYSSLSGLGQAGLGWQIDIGRIERSVKKGVPGLTDADLFQFSVGGAGGELMATGGGSYRARIESQFKQFRKLANGWEMRDSTGNLFRFGSSDASRVGPSVAGSAVPVTWMLDEIRDPNGNVVTITYETDGGVLYPSELRYGGHAPSNEAGLGRVVFEYESRPDQRITYTFGFRQETRRRLSRVSAFIDGSLARRYAVQYQTSPSSDRSLIAGLSLVGRDDSSQINARSFQYRNRVLGWQSSSLGGLPANLNDADGRELGVRVADVNGDNFADVVLNGTGVFLGDGLGGFQADAAWGGSLGATGVTFVNGDGVDTGGRLIDVDGDLRPDLVVANQGTRRVFLNNGTGWALDTAFSDSLDAIAEPGATPDGGSAVLVPLSTVGPDGDAQGVMFADLNGDGLTDILWSFRTTDNLPGNLPDGGPPVTARGQQDIRAVYLNTGSGWSRDESLSNSLRTPNSFVFVADTQIRGYDLVDVNGDGISDIVDTLQGAADRQVFLGNGRGWESDAAYTASLNANDIISLSSDRKPKGLSPIDFNGDGLTDYVRAEGSTVKAFRNTGSGWNEDAGIAGNLSGFGFQLVDGDSKSTGTTFADVDGDGLIDVIAARDQTPSTIHPAAGEQGDLLIRAMTGLGEVTTLDYVPSTAFDNRTASGIQGLPMVLSVVSAVVRSDGRGNDYPFGYVYAGGLMRDRQYRGFLRVDETEPTGVVQRSLFARHDEEALAGRPTQFDTIEPGGFVVARREFTYELPQPTSGVTQPREIQRDETTFDRGDATHPSGSQHTRVRTSYDQFMNVAEVAKDGDLAVSGDETRTVIRHVLNLVAGITDPPSRISVFDSGGVLVSQSITFYDHLPEGQVTQGNPTFVADAVQIGGQQVSRRMTYDKYGNVLTATARGGATTSFEYDTDQHAFRVRAIDVLSRSTRSRFDPLSGVPIAETDPNGRVTTRDLDAFGRLRRETRPGDEASAAGTKSIEYSALGDASSQFVIIRSTEAQGSASTLDVRSFVDGFGQVYRLETEGESGTTVVVTTEFDHRGNVVASSRPFFSGATPAVTTMVYDAVARLVRVTEPDGIAQTTMYFAGTLAETVNRGGAVSRFRRDAYGNTREQHQIVGGADLVTKYEYNAFGKPVKVTDPLGETTRITYDALGQRTKIDDPSQGTTAFSYDDGGHLSAQTDAQGRTNRFSYDAAGQLTRKELADGQVFRYRHDGSAAANSIGRIASVVDGAGQLDLTYDVRGNIVERKRTIDGEVYLTGASYDSLGRLRRVAYPDGFVVEYHYNAAGAVERITDNKGQTIVSNVDYNAAGQATDIRYGNGTAASHTYDTLLRPTEGSVTDGRGALVQRLANSFDPVGNVTATTDLVNHRDQTFSYDEISRLRRAVGPYGDERYDYDAIGNLLRKGELLMAYDPVRKQLLSCGIDAKTARMLLALQQRDPRGFDQKVPKDVRSCLADIRQRVPTGPTPSGFPDLGNTFVARYDAVGNLTSRAETSYAYDAENRLFKIVGKDGKVERNVYDAQGNRLVRRTDGHDDDESIFVDDLFELNGDQALRHVRLGNMLVATIATPRHLLRLLERLDPDQLQSWAELSAAEEAATNNNADQGCTLGRGHSERAPLWSIVFLAAVIVMARSPHRAAQPLGRYVRTALGLTRSAWKGLRHHPGRWLIALLLVPAYVVCSANVGRAWADGRAPSFEERLFYHTDHIGSVMLVSDEHGRVVREQQFKPFGELHRESTAGDETRNVEFGFQSARADGKIGLSLFGHRFYDATIGRFLNADSKIQDYLQPQQLHRYSFGMNNPVRAVDPTGHSWLDVIIGVFVVLVIVVLVVVTFGAATPVLAIAIGAAIGLVVGAAAGAAIAYFKYGFSPTDARFWRLVGAGALIGAALGGAVGSVVGVPGAISITSYTLTTQVLLGAGLGGLGAAISGADKGFTDTWLMGVILGAGLGAGLAYANGTLSDFLKPFLAAGFTEAAYAAADLLELTAGYGLGYQLACALRGEQCEEDESELIPEPSTSLTYGSLSTPITGVPGWVLLDTGVSAGGRGRRGLFDTAPITP